ncbi:hypothetical protein L202_02296 [Cryptococcus amylolentus CBS 6039]|uniref:Diphthamide biosynthesis protein 3 n=2 Tax=Cryptococcus amylolentus TaxID=104669 RepID=A0A1E3I053_9TREE|nr:hypothetical protein L202_02296 [Cryptococcus amylolentus CBS 6039]ODN81960.1 hypothetical protein L202_02296 [Cryptococcus amylolentus CBS 6039]ODO09899.1 hypothetical protein I350_02121 [Cryptococcus amylolentus CBS 6273]
MPNYYDELEIEDFAWDPVANVFHYPCPCGDRFEISKGQLRDGEEIAICPSCSLIVRVIYDYLDWEDYVTSDEDGELDEEEVEEEEEEDEDGKNQGKDEDITPETSVSPATEAAETKPNTPPSPSQSHGDLASQLGDRLNILGGDQRDTKGEAERDSGVATSDR